MLTVLMYKKTQVTQLLAQQYTYCEACGRQIDPRDPGYKTWIAMGRPPHPYEQFWHTCGPVRAESKTARGGECQAYKKYGGVWAKAGNIKCENPALTCIL